MRMRVIANSELRGHRMGSRKHHHRPVATPSSEPLPVELEVTSESGESDRFFVEGLGRFLVDAGSRP
jgi:hypothetical protein